MVWFAFILNGASTASTPAAALPRQGFLHHPKPLGIQELTVQIPQRINTRARDGRNKCSNYSFYSFLSNTELALIKIIGIIILIMIRQTYTPRQRKHAQRIRRRHTEAQRSGTAGGCDGKKFRSGLRPQSESNKVKRARSHRPQVKRRLAMYYFIFALAIQQNSLCN